MELIYIAGPYRGDNEWEVQQNIRKAEQKAIELWKKGWVVICPHKNTAHFGGILPDTAWLEGDLEIISRCDAIYMLDNWDQSEGAIEEFWEAAELEISIYCENRPAPDLNKRSPTFASRPLIGLSGKKQSGKTEVAKYLEREYGYYKLSFAKRLKEIARDVLGWDGEKDQKGREFLQKLGTEAVRNYNPDFWIEELEKKIRDIDKPIVIDDVRFPNEADFVRELNGKLIRVIRRKFPNDNNHASEVALDNWDFDWILHNNMTLNHLYRLVDRMMEEII